MTAVKIIAFAVILIAGLVFFTLQRNDANLFQAPGFYKRLSVYLTTNTAETSDNHPFEELRTPVFSVGADKLYQRVLYVAAESGWSILANDSENQNANFVARTPVFLFEDDVYIQVQFINMNESSLYIQSSSRTGRADLAANAGHIQALIKAIKE
ncbi:MAG: hypothetical protein BMS9Abin19_0740 [Gammaproteobacteria bacterium]|nr:MAG: hypothetical protein BMS9Abin19_0740 [Gammaproteobacteria bacterium]